MLMVQFRLVVVPLAGLEPARGLPRGILRHMRQKLTLTKTIKNRAFLAKNRLKTPQNQCFSYFLQLIRLLKFS